MTLGQSRPRLFVTAFLTIACTAGCAALFGAPIVDQMLLGRTPLPDLGPFERFEFPSVGRIYDSRDEPLIEVALENRQITAYLDIPPVVRNAVLAVEDRRFFAHNGVDYLSFPRVLAKVRVGAWIARLASGGRRDSLPGPAIFPQGGSTITQQLTRGVFLRDQTSRENSHELRDRNAFARVLAVIIGARNTNMAIRKAQEMGLSLWMEREMAIRFGSKQRAKEEILARYVSYVYMGNGQYGLAQAAEYYFGRPLSTFTAGDADKAALLAGIAKSPRDYAPTARNAAPVLRRRNQTLALMAAGGFISEADRIAASKRPLPNVVAQVRPRQRFPAVLEHVLDHLALAHADLDIEDLLQGRVQVYSTVDARMQDAVVHALEAGLERYERRHRNAKGLVQGSVVVLRNRDGAVLAEVGGRQVFRGRPTSYSDFNRVTQSRRQPGSAMKPIVYLAAFQRGALTLETLVPDEPIAVSTGPGSPPKWIANYDGRFRGLIPVREALAESRNAVAVWIASQIGIGAVLRTARSLGVETPLLPYPSTALGASELTLLELATAYRTIASGVVAKPFVIRRIVRDAGEAETAGAPRPGPVMAGAALSAIQEGLRGVVRIPSGTAHALDARTFPLKVMGKTGTTNEFRDALFVGSTYGPGGITVAVRVGFDDSRSLGPGESGGRVALPIFRDVMLGVYRDGSAGPEPGFPVQMERHITEFLSGNGPKCAESGPWSPDARTADAASATAPCDHPQSVEE